MTDTFTIWKSGVCVGLGAPDDAINTDTLWAWQSAEGGIGHNNPLNTTYSMAGAVPWNTLPNGLHVWSYVDIADGINATVVTLLAPDPSVGLPNGYDVIVDHLRRSIPRAQWGDACWQLDKWGTGCGWLTTNYGAAAGSATGEDMATAMLIKDSRGATWFAASVFGPKRPVANSNEENAYTGALTALGADATVRTDIPQFVVDMMDDDPGSASPRFEDATKAELDAIKAELAAGTDAGTAAAVARIEAALKAA